MENQPTERQDQEFLLRHDTWFIAFCGSTITAVSVLTGILTESNISEPRAGIIATGFALSACITGRKALQNFREAKATGKES